MGFNDAEACFHLSVFQSAAKPRDHDVPSTLAVSFLGSRNMTLYRDGAAHFDVDAHKDLAS